MKHIYILLINSNTFLSRIIRRATNAEYTHASISFSDNLFPFCSFGRKFAFSPIPAGLKLEPFKKGFFKYNQNIQCGLYRLSVSEVQYDGVVDYLFEIYEDEKRWGFNTLGLFACKFGHPIKRKHRMFCSEFVASALNRGGITNYDNPALVQPIHFVELDGIECLYRGTIAGLEHFNVHSL